MRSVLAVVLLLAAHTPAWTQEAKSPGPGAGSVNEIGSGARRRSATGGGGPHATTGYPPGVPTKTTWIPFERLSDLPEKSGTHGIMRVPGPGVGWAIGFLTYGSVPEGARLSGQCASQPSPSTPTPDICRVWTWISARPGGPPLKNCLSGPGRGAPPSTMRWFVFGRGAPRTRTSCELQPGRRYYCHYIATGWENNPAHCDRTMNSPIGGTDP